MPRKSTKSASASASRSSSKRPAQDTPTRQSKRAKAAARKSYAEPDSDATKRASVAPDDESVAEASDFEETGDGDQSSESEQEETATSDEDVKPKKGVSRIQSAKRSLPLHSKHGDERDLWKAGAKLEPGTQLIIKKPKARGKNVPKKTYCETPTDIASSNCRGWRYTIYR
jgi:hypothetical protein